MIALAVLIALTLAIIAAFAMNPPTKTPTHEVAERQRARAARQARAAALEAQREREQREPAGRHRELASEGGESGRG